MPRSADCYHYLWLCLHLRIELLFSLRLLVVLLGSSHVPQELGTYIAFKFHLSKRTGLFDLISVILSVLVVSGMVL